MSVFQHKQRGCEEIRFQKTLWLLQGATSIQECSFGVGWLWSSNPVKTGLWKLHGEMQTYLNVSERKLTFSDKASSRVASAVSVLLESVCKLFTLSFRLVSCLSLSLSCSCKFSIWNKKINENLYIIWRETDKKKYEPGIIYAGLIHLTTYALKSHSTPSTISVSSRACVVINSTLFIQY